MPIKPDNLPFREELRQEFVTTEQVLRFIKDAVKDSSRFGVDATWASDHKARDISQEADLDDLEDAHDVTELLVLATYPDDTTLSLTMGGFASYASGASGTAAERARWIAAKWRRLPNRRRNFRWTIGTISAGIVAAWVAVAALILINSGPIGEGSLWLFMLKTLGPAIAAYAMVTVLQGLSGFDRGTKIVDDNHDWWSDWRSTIPIVISIAAVVVAIAVS